MIIYVLVNTINQNCYVGQTTRTLDERILEHKNCKKTCIGRAIKMYGWENFTVKILEECNNIERLNEREVFWIAKYNSIAPNGYNLKNGGNNGTHSAESRSKISVANTGKKRSAETRKKFSESKTGTRLTEETRARMSLIRKGKPKSDKTRAKMKLAQEKNRKEIYCIETAEIFESICMAAKCYGIQSGEISSVCNGKRNTASGLHWSFFEDWLVADAGTKAEFLSKTPHRKKCVRCVETNEIFSSIRAAAEKYGTDHKNISRACDKMTRTALGFHWEFVKE